MPPAAIMGGGMALGAVGSFFGASKQADAAQNAAQMQADAANHASDLQFKMFREQEAEQAPWRQAGADALTKMQDSDLRRGFTMNDFQADPGYQFRMQQGQSALERSAAAHGGLQSGGTLKALTEYGQNFASNEYQNAYNRFTNDQSNRFNRLASIAGVGQTANAELGKAGQNYANQVGQNTMGAANAAGAAGIAGAQAWSGAAKNLSSLASNGANTWMGYQQMQKTNNLLDRMYPAGGGGGGGAVPAMPSADSFSYTSPTFGAIGG